MIDVASATIGPRNLNRIRFEAWRHDMQNRTDFMNTSSFFRVMIHAEADEEKQK